MLNPLATVVIEGDAPAPCRLCGTPTLRIVHTVDDGDAESGPFTVNEPVCQPCNDRLAAEADHDPPCEFCGAPATVGATCCQEAAAYEAWAASVEAEQAATDAWGSRPW